MNWKACVGCGEPTLLSLYCADCFNKNFRRKPDARRVKTKYTTNTVEWNKQMAALKELFESFDKDLTPHPSEKK